MRLKKYAAQKNNDLGMKIKSYSALTGAFLASMGNADAQVVFTDFNPDVVIDNSSFDIDLDDDGIIDFRISQNGPIPPTTTIAVSHFEAKIFSPVYASNKVKAVKTTYWSQIYTYWPAVLHQGNAISPSVGGFYSFQVGHSPNILAESGGQNTAYGFWRNQTGYIGINFKSGTNDYYGWIHCFVTNDIVVIMDYAYDSIPHTGIIAGDTVAVVNTGTDEKPNREAWNLINVFPNPVTGNKLKILIRSLKNETLTIEVLDGMGRVIKAENRSVFAGKNELPFLIPPVAAGIYYVKLISKDRIVHKKISVVTNR